MKTFTKFKKAWKSETPKFWKWCAGASVTVIAAIGAINTVAATATPPEWFVNYQWHILAVAAVLGFFAKTRTKKGGIK